VKIYNFVCQNSDCPTKGQQFEILTNETLQFGDLTTCPHCNQKTAMKDVNGYAKHGSWTTNPI